MPKFSIASELRVPYTLAAFAGVLLALAFPRVSIAGFAWVAPGLLLFAAAGFRPGLTFRIGYLGGFVYYLCTLNWLLYIPVKFFPILGWIALSAYLSLYPALWVWICWKFYPKKGSSPAAPEKRRERAAALLSGAWW